jgi:hypothetical protein
MERPRKSAKEIAMANDVASGRPGCHKLHTLPRCDGSYMDMIQEATGWKQVCLESLEGKTSALVKAFLSGLQVMAPA